MLSKDIEVEIIVHPAGLLDADDAGYWTEVAALPACIAEGRTVEEAVAKTTEAIIRWLEKEQGHGEPQIARQNINLIITMAV